MADDIARLGIEVDSKKIKEAIKRLDKLEEQSGKTEKSVAKIGSAIGFIGGAAKVAGIVALTTKIIGVAASFEKLNASLKTVTGSQEAATAAMDGIKGLASETPFSVQELTDSFIKLKALGLDPSREALISYGNTASAMGKDLNQMIEAVADASTGEFERLKEFGIKASSQGDQVSFTFQGVTKTVKKNSEEIQKYLMDIGEVQFAGAMSEQMNTLDGRFSNLGDSADRLAVAIGEAGLSDAVKVLTGGLAGMLNTMAEVIEIQKDPAPDAMLTHKVAIRDLTEQLTATNKTLDYYLSLQEQAANPEAAAVFERQAEALKAQADEMQRAINVLQGDMGAAKKAKDAAPEEKKGITDGERKALEEKLAALQEYYMTEQELALKSLRDKQALITELENEGIGTEDERRELRLEATQEYENALLAIAQDRIDREQDAKAKADAEEQKRIEKNTAFAIRAMESGNQSATQLLKGYLLDQAKMLGRTAIVGAYKWGATIGGPPAGAAAAAAASLAVGALINAIDTGGGSSASPAAAGGSTVGEGGGIGPEPQGIQQSEGTQEKVIRFEDLDPDTFMTVKNVFKMLNEATDRGYRFEVG